MPTSLQTLAGRAERAADEPPRTPVSGRAPRPSAREELARAQRRARETARRLAELERRRTR